MQPKMVIEGSNIQPIAFHLQLCDVFLLLLIIIIIFRVSEVSSVSYFLTWFVQNMTQIELTIAFSSFWVVIKCRFEIDWSEFFSSPLLKNKHLSWSVPPNCVMTVTMIVFIYFFLIWQIWSIEWMIGWHAILQIDILKKNLDFRQMIRNWISLPMVFFSIRSSDSRWSQKYVSSNKWTIYQDNTDTNVQRPMFPKQAFEPRMEWLSACYLLWKNFVLCFSYFKIFSYAVFRILRHKVISYKKFNDFIFLFNNVWKINWRSRWNVHTRRKQKCKTRDRQTDRQREREREREM